ncbi:acyl-phosphate glycerol-3-phosphate acyltransferase [cyanobacterium endosymbiont of Rhopalodia gibberula]|uniref:glycerol-3-phosphate 1-O-acyltransferase PlsY n=1 Tax=cyanobacterium endosymbiont of Rhopalodia gibberula TaxID=1763363 RepID=UPI000DC6F089|nr:glycerol-3-phosphate 1-O-acyltransferase PlsY [cyanobacterium endosymbiont of Rhopalodia gibberula]BBA79660.1 acyl-phosphate glycerol-3-phosphate acyltransferase [cyanobacterium endosymbiont of Rhopalodia gibberula]
MAWVISGFLCMVAYLLGSIPTGYLVGRVLKGIDIREHGSGSTGATNVLRILGKTAAVLVLITDLGKAILSVAMVKWFYLLAPTGLITLDWKPWLMIVTAMAVVFGHSKSIFLNFTGGKSVAAGLGVLFVLNPLVALGSLTSFLLMLSFSKIVSLSSLTGVLAVNILMIWLHQPLPYCIFALVAGLYVIIRHSTNINRLFEGKEPKIGQNLQNSSLS